MGKYIRKSKMTGDVVLVEISESSLGVLTRAKTLALQRLKKLASSAPPSPAAATAVGGGNYLQLRSRRLLKQPPVLLNKRQKLAPPPKERSFLKPNPNARKLSSSSRSGSEGGIQNFITDKEREEAKFEKGKSSEDIAMDLGVEASFGENVLKVEGRERTTRESTPCSLIRDSNTIRTPGSTSKPTSTTNNNRRLGSSSCQHIPTNEMDEFFTGPEEEQQKQFIEKYNFDPVNEKPLPGRYQWEKAGT